MMPCGGRTSWNSLLYPAGTFERGTAPIERAHDRSTRHHVHDFVLFSERKNGPQGFSNPREVPEVVNQAKAAMRRYGARADIRVITFYNMQRLALGRAFQTHRKLKGISIVSVRI